MFFYKICVKSILSFSVDSVSTKSLEIDINRSEQVLIDGNTNEDFITNDTVVKEDKDKSRSSSVDSTDSDYIR